MNKKIIMFVFGCLINMSISAGWTWNYSNLTIKNLTHKDMYLYRASLYETTMSFYFEKITIKSQKTYTQKISYKDLGFFFSLGDTCPNLTNCCQCISTNTCYGFFFDNSSEFFSKFSEQGSFALPSLNLNIYISSSLSKTGKPLFFLRAKNSDSSFQLYCGFDSNNTNGACCKNNFCNSIGEFGLNAGLKINNFQKENFSCNCNNSCK